MRRSVVIFLTTVLSTAVAAADDSRAIAKLLSDINTAVREDKRRMLRVHSARHLLARSFMLLAGGKRGVRSRDKLDIWHDGKREAKTRDPVSGSVPG